MSAWTREVASLILPHLPNESYQNFPDRRIVGWQPQYHAENVQGLIEGKTPYEPSNDFQNAESIPVSPSSRT